MSLFRRFGRTHRRPAGPSEPVGWTYTVVATDEGAADAPNGTLTSNGSGGFLNGGSASTLMGLTFTSLADGITAMGERYTYGSPALSDYAGAVWYSQMDIVLAVDAEPEAFFNSDVYSAVWMSIQANLTAYPVLASLEQPEVGGFLWLGVPILFPPPEYSADFGYVGGPLAKLNGRVLFAPLCILRVNPPEPTP